MKRVEFHFEILQRALKRHFAVGELRNSITKGERNLTGYLGEEMFKELYPTAILKDFNDYDFLYKNKKIEIKTRIINHQIRPDYSFTVHSDQSCDFYVFCAIHSSIEYGIVAGYISKKDFLRVSRPVKKGEPHPGVGVYQMDGRNIFVNQLRELK